jgi:hypothetical protein
MAGQLRRNTQLVCRNLKLEEVDQEIREVLKAIENGANFPSEAQSGF